MARPGSWDPTPLGAIAGVAALGLVALVGSACRQPKERAARSVYVFLHFTWNLLYTIVILDSKDLCATLGMSAADSGRMVGMSYLGMAVGATGMWLLLRLRPEMWRSFSRVVLASGATCQLLSATAYAYIVATASAGEGSFNPQALATLLVVSRFVQGVGAGSNMQFYMATSLCLTEVADRPDFSMSIVLGGCAGCGCGLIFAAFLSTLHTAAAEVATAAATIAAVLLVHPSLADVDDRRGSGSAPAAADGSSAEDNSRSRKVVILGVTALGCVRKAMWGATEVAPALLLTDEFHWDRRAAGLATGAALLSTIPARIIYRYAAHLLTPGMWFRVLAALVATSLAFCFEEASDLAASAGLSGAGMLMGFLAACLAFLFLLEGLLVGTMQQHVLPAGSRFDGNHAQLWYIIALGTGGFLGPWVSRLAIQERGQDAFALAQLTMGVVFAIGFETVVAPRMCSFPPTAAKPARQPTAKLDQRSMS